MPRKSEEVADELFAALQLFGELFTANGVLKKRFNTVRELIGELKESDPGYQKKLGVSKPYGQEVNGEMMRFLVSQYLGGRWYADTPLVVIIDRLFAQVGVPGNPLNE